MMNSIIESENQNDNSSTASLDPRDRIALESNYIQQNISAFKTIRNRNYQKSADIYKECLSIAEQLKDTYKINDSLCNYSIALFYNGNTKECLEKLEGAYRSYTCQQSLKIANSLNKNSDIRISMLNAKIISNLTIVYLSIGKIAEASKTFRSLIEIINNQRDANKSLSLLKSILYIFFRVDSIIDIPDIIPGRTYIKDNDTDDFHKRIIIKIINCYHMYLRNNNIDIWIQCLTEEIDNLKQLKDYNGLIFSIFNVNASAYAKSINMNDVSTMANSKAKLTALIKALIGDKDVDERMIDKIANGVRDKMEFTVNMYKNMYDLEEELRIKIKNKRKEEDDERVTEKNVFFIKFLLNYSLKYINMNITDVSLKSQLKMQIDITLKLISKNEIDLSNLKLKLLSPEIEKAISQLGENLIFIRNKCESNKKKVYFNRYHKIANMFKLNERYESIIRYTRECYNAICRGDMLTKVNLTTSGTKNHFYQLDFNTDSILVFKRKDSTRSDKSAEFKVIQKIIFGIETNNLKKKYKSLEYNTQPWLYMSIILNEKITIDLCLSDENIKKWFYGLFFYLSSTQRHYKIPSVTGFVLNRIKMKSMSTLINYSENGNMELSSKFNIKKLINTYKDSPSRTSLVKVIIEMNKLYKL